ncbi:MAG: response regulator transcription factor [Dehalococcoidia bacterium]|nr:response regulator transcription factor [Dehalococcoidia bacterium]
MITIVLVDDHKIVRQGLTILLGDEPDIKIVGEAAKAEEAIALVENLKPDILICDLILNGLNGIDVTREVRKRVPETKVIILSMYNDSGFVSRAVREGASGWVLKGSGIDELLTAIRQAVAGRTYFSPSVERDNQDKGK